MKRRVIGWWSGGLPSAIACEWALKLWGKDVVLVFTDTRNEADDTQRFKEDCQRWYGRKIETLWNQNYTSIQDVWRKYTSLNVATGAICSTELKRVMREDFQRPETDLAQIFGFDSSELNRHLNMRRNYPEINALSPCIYMGYSKTRCAEIIQNEWRIELPEAYRKGFRNNNCRKTGCVQGGIGYWQKIEIDEPPVFDAMAAMEHELTDKKGKPVTCNKDQSKEAKENGRFQVFLKPHPDYPEYKDLSMISGKPVEPLPECIGFCNTKD